MNRRHFLKSAAGLAILPFIPKGLLGDDDGVELVPKYLSVEGIAYPLDNDVCTVFWTHAIRVDPGAGLYIDQDELKKLMDKECE